MFSVKNYYIVFRAPVPIGVSNRSGTFNSFMSERIALRATCWMGYLMVVPGVKLAASFG